LTANAGDRARIVSAVVRASGREIEKDIENKKDRELKNPEMFF
jgi:hypothetical protein